MRKLLCAACGYTAALLLAHYLLPWDWLLLAGGCFVLLGFAALALHGTVRRAAMLVLLSAAVGCGWYWGYTRLFVRPADAFVGEERTVEVQILDYPDVYEDYTVIKVRSTDEEMPHVRMLVYDYDAGMAELRPGDLAALPLKLRSARSYYREESDRYLSEGILLRGTLCGTYSVTGRSRLAWLRFPQHIARAVREQALECFPRDVAALMKALLTGDKREYYADDALYSAMKTSGFSHIVAVSGMHVAFLVSALRLILGRRRRTALVCIPMVVIFMAMTGFTPSVVRAGLMQIMLLAAPLLQREYDPLTGLSAAALLLLILNPLSVGSMGLQLSFCATAGLLLFSPGIYALLARDAEGGPRFGRSLPGRAAEGVCAVLSASVGAIVLTLPVSVLWVGFVPLYSVLTNLLCLWAMTAAFLLGYPVCLLGLLWPEAACALGGIVGWLPRYAAFVVQKIAALPWAILCTGHNLIGWWLGFVYAVFGTAYLMREGRLRPLLPVCVCICTLLLVTGLPERELAGGLEFSALDVGQGQSLALLTENGTVLIDCGSSGSAVNAGDAAAEYLMRFGRRRVDLLVLTHFHSDHVSGVKRLLSRTDVERVAYSEDCVTDEDARALLALCTDAGTELLPVAEDTDITVDGLELRLYVLPGGAEDNERCLMLRGAYGEFEFLVTGDSDSTAERSLRRLRAVGDLELLVVGHHGSRTSTCAELLDAVTPETAVISVGAGNRYGHPSAEVLARLAERNIAVFRTDTGGTITVTVGEEYGKKQ